VTRFEAPITEQTFQRSSIPAVKIEDSEVAELPASSSNRRWSRSSSVDRSVPSIQSRSASPGPPPPLVDPDDIPQYLLAQFYSPEAPASPEASSYTLESSFDPNTFSFNPMSTSPVPSVRGNSSSELAEDSLSSAFSMFDEVSSATGTRPSLSVDTSYSEMSPLPMMHDWTRSSSPISANNMSIPSTPCYPSSPMLGQYNPAFTSYRSHGLRHTSSSLSLESTSSFDSFESTSSYEDFSTAYSNDYHPLDASTTSSDYHQYTQEMPIFIAGSDVSDFAAGAGAYGSTAPISCGSQIDDIAFVKAQAHLQYHAAVDSFIDFSTFISSPLSLGQC